MALTPGRKRKKNPRVRERASPVRRTTTMAAKKKAATKKKTAKKTKK